MPNAWTAEQILAFAPDSSSLKAAQEQSAPRRWTGLARTDTAAWGLCQGSAKEPYRTQIDLGEPAFRCSCPSRKIPCKHSIGLFLLLASQPAAFSSVQPPDWVADWLAARRRAAKHAPPPEPAPAAVSEAQQKRQAQREARVAAGIEELERWLADALHEGLGALPGKDPRYWEAPARRLVDAQAPGLARLVRLLPAIPASGDGWQGRLLEALGHLHLLLDAYRRIDTLPEAVQADVRSLVGWTLKGAELLENRGLRDEWLVTAQMVTDEGSNGHTLHVQRTWLWGLRSGHPALVLHFAPLGQPLDYSLTPGTALEAELVYFPSAAPLRALVKARFSLPAPFTRMPGCPDLASLTGEYARGLAACPWLESWPGAVENVTPLRHENRWQLVDSTGSAVPLAPGITQPWQLLAISGGRPLSVFGEWDGQCFLPLSCLMDGEWRSLAAPRRDNGR